MLMQHHQNALLRTFVVAWRRGAVWILTSDIHESNIKH
jgi:hypothetical protein